MIVTLEQKDFDVIRLIFLRKFQIELSNEECYQVWNNLGEYCKHMAFSLGFSDMDTQVAIEDYLSDSSEEDWLIQIINS